MEFIIHVPSTEETCRIILLLGNQNDNNPISNHNKKYNKKEKKNFGETKEQSKN